MRACTAASGGGIGAYRLSTLTLEGVEFAGCEALSFGGALSVRFESTLRATNVSFSACKAFDGVVLRVQRAFARLVDSVVADCHAAADGGMASLKETSHFELTRCTVTRATAGERGGVNALHDHRQQSECLNCCAAYHATGEILSIPFRAATRPSFFADGPATLVDEADQAAASLRVLCIVSSVHDAVVHRHSQLLALIDLHTSELSCFALCRTALKLAVSMGAGC